MQQLKHIAFRLILILFLGSPLIGLAQYDIPPKPEFQTSVYDDDIKLLSVSEKNSLEQKLIRYSDTTSTQIVIAIISSTKGEYINYLGAQWAEEWGGELNIEGEVIKYKPGDFVLFDSDRLHRSQEIKKIPYWRISISYVIEK